MKAPLKWLKDYTDIDKEIKEFCDIMTMSGTKVEGYELAGRDIKNVVTGKIIELTDHTDSEHLKIAKVDIGTDILQVVTGAPNVKNGQIVPIATDNAVLPKNVVIKKGKIRGVESEGMMCSIAELNLTKHDYPDASDDGIWVLKENTPLGVDIKEYAGLDDYVIEFEITPNRQDCYSIKGIAREAAAALAKPFKDQPVKLCELGDKQAKDYIKVGINSYDLCSRYCARIVTNVTIRQSPEWMRHRLRNAGVRPINNIVDITNYVMLEMGQPMHAFDMEYLEGSEIIVRRAKKGEMVTTLDDKQRLLDTSMLVIADKVKTVAVAGVMGAQNSEVKENTETVLFESATFNFSSVRITAKKLGLRTESSALFEKGLDENNALDAINRACELVEMINAGKVVKGTVDVHQALPELGIIYLDVDRINGLLGTSITRDRMVEILTRLHMTVDDDNKVVVPAFRKDIKILEDLTEEVARFFDYNNIQPSLTLGDSVTQGRRSHEQIVRKMIRDTLAASGLNETMTFSFVSPKNLDKLGLDRNDPLRKYMEIKNPLGEDFSVMRTSIIPSMLKVASYNINRNVENGRFFEISKTYHPQGKSHIEIETITAAVYGNTDFYMLKGVLDKALQSVGIDNVEYRQNTNNRIYHLGRCADIYINNTYLGTMGQINYDVSLRFDAPQDTYMFTVAFDVISKNADFSKTYKPLPRFPYSQRDLSITVDKNISNSAIISCATQTAGEILEEMRIFDMYTGEQIEQDKKSLSYSLIFRLPDRTLEERQVSTVFNDIVKALSDRLGANIRA